MQRSSNALPEPWSCFSMGKLRALDFDMRVTKRRRTKTGHLALQTISPRDDFPASNLPEPDLSTYEIIGHSLHQSSLVRLLTTSSPFSSKLQMKANQPWQFLQKSRDVQQNASTSSSELQMKTLQHRPTQPCLRSCQKLQMKAN